MMVAVAMMPAVTVVPAAMMHLLGGGYLVRRGAEARPERQRRRRRGLRGSERDRGAGQSHQDELSHAFLSLLVDFPRTLRGHGPR